MSLMNSPLSSNANIRLESPKGASKNFWWLLSDFNASSWHFKPQVVTDERSKYIINWFRDGVDSEDLRWAYWVGRAKEQLVCRMEDLETRSYTTSSLVNHARSLRVFFRFLCFDRKCFHFEDVCLGDVHAYKNSLHARNLSRSTVEGYLAPITYMYNRRATLSESLKFNPFKNENIYSYAKKTAKPDGHTNTLLPREIFFILNEALKKIKNSSQTLDLLDEYMKIKKLSEEQVTGFSKPSFKFKKNHGQTVKKLITDVSVLYGAALTVTFLLIAERKHEAALREESSVVDLLEQGVDVLKGLEMKTSGSVSGKRTEVAVIQEVKDAFKIIMRITKYRREESGETKVLLKMPFVHSTKRDNNKSYYLLTRDLYRVLDSFTSAVGMETKLRPHMFRRAYAMLWMWRYEIGELDELSIMLKHNSTAFTTKYTDDEDIWKFMPDVEQRMTFDILNNAFQKKVMISGGASNTLERYGRLIQAKSRLLDPLAIAGVIDELIEIEGLKVVSHADGYCFISTETKAQSKCLNENGDLSEELREDSRCVGCPNFGVDDKRRSYWEKRIDLHQLVVGNSANSTLVISSKIFIEKANKLLMSNMLINS